MRIRTRERIDASQLDIKDTVVSINRVTKVVKGGKNLSFSALVVVGDGHGVVGNYGAGSVLLKPAPDGTGIIAGGSVRAVVEAAGVTNILTKSLGSANPHNVVRATVAGLASLKDPATIARMRGKELEELMPSSA